MKRIFLIVCLILPTYALAQSTKPQPAISLSAIEGGSAGPTVTAKPEEKPKPVILDKARLMELENLNLRLQNLQLTLELQKKAIAKSEEEAKAADEALAKFWLLLGIKREELATKWEASNGLDGAIVLKPKEEAKKN